MHHKRGWSVKKEELISHLRSALLLAVSSVKISAIQGQTQILQICLQLIQICLHLIQLV